MGPVGPDTCVLVPPNIAAKKPTAIAPYIPDIAPTPDATPKARANGKATIAVVKPARRSFLIEELVNIFRFFRMPSLDN